MLSSFHLPDGALCNGIQKDRCMACAVFVVSHLFLCGFFCHLCQIDHHLASGRCCLWFFRSGAVGHIATHIHGFLITGHFIAIGFQRNAGGHSHAFYFLFHGGHIVIARFLEVFILILFYRLYQRCTGYSVVHRQGVDHGHHVGFVAAAGCDGSLSIQNTANQQVPDLNVLTPLLVVDLWEHAYYLQYRSNRERYLDNWWYLTNWGFADSQYRQSMTE